MKLSKRTVVALFLIGLPLHTFLMMVLFGALRIPSNIIGILSTWKEGLVGCITLLIAVSQIWRKRPRFIRLTVTDCFVILFALWVGARLIWSYVVGSNLPLNATLYGLRFYLLPIALYAMGRLVPLNNHNLRQMLWGITQ